ARVHGLPPQLDHVLDQLRARARRAATRPASRGSRRARSPLVRRRARAPLHTGEPHASPRAALRRDPHRRHGPDRRGRPAARALTRPRRAALAHLTAPASASSLWLVPLRRRPPPRVTRV